MVTGQGVDVLWSAATVMFAPSGGASLFVQQQSNINRQMKNRGRGSLVSAINSPTASNANFYGNLYK